MIYTQFSTSEINGVELAHGHLLKSSTGKMYVVEYLKSYSRWVLKQFDVVHQCSSDRIAIDLYQVLDGSTGHTYELAGYFDGKEVLTTSTKVCQVCHGIRMINRHSDDTKHCVNCNTAVSWKLEEGQKSDFS